MPQNVTDFANLLYQAILHKQWGVVAAAALVGFVALARWGAPKLHDGIGNFLNSQRGGALLALGGGIGGGLLTAFLGGQHFSLPLLGAGFMVGLSAIGGWNAFWDIFFPTDKAPKAPDVAAPITTDPGSTPKSGAAMLPFLAIPLAALLGASLISGCGYCWQTAHEQEPKCVIAHDVVQCLEGDAADAVAIAATILSAVVDSGTISQGVWDAVKSMAEKLGFKTGGCFWAKLQEYFNTPSASMARVQFVNKCQLHFDEFKAKYNVPGVKFCFQKAGKQVCH